MSRQKVIAFIILFIVNLFFFASFYWKGMLPFPGDLLLAEYNPFRQSSFFGFSAGAVPHKAQSFDALRQLYPWRFLSIKMLKQGQWPLWNPYNFSGTPLLANFQSAVFYPLNFLYWLFNFKTAWGFQVVIQPLLASFFFFVFARRLKISFRASLLAAITFGYSSFMTVWLEYNTIGHVLLWLPLVLWLVELLKEKITFWRTSALVAALTLALLAGHFQDWAMIWLFSLIYYFWRVQKKLGTFLWLLPFFFAAAQVLPGLELIFNSARTALSKDFLLQKVLLQPWQIVFSWAPDFFGNPATRNYFLGDTYIGKVLYIGMLPLFFAILALLVKSSRWVKFFGLTTLVSLFLAMRTPISGWLYSLPIFSSISATRVLFLYQFSLALLAGIGFDVWQKIKDKRWWGVVVGFGLLFLISWLFASGKLGLGGETFLSNLGVVRRNLLYSSLLFMVTMGLLFLGKQKFFFLRKIIPWLMIVFVVLDLFRFFKKITPFSPPEYVFPQVEVFDVLKEKRERFWGYGTASIPSNYNLIYEVYSTEGYDPLYPQWYGEWVRFSEEGSFRPAIRSDAFISPGFGKEDFPNNPARQKILTSLSVKYILDRDENQSDETTFPSGDYPMVWQKGGWRIHENKKAAPRAFWADKIYLAKFPQEVEAIFNRSDFLPQNQVILETPPEEESFSVGEIEMIDYQPNKVTLKTKNETAGLLVLTDTDYPGWQAAIDGQKTVIYRANHAFRAIFVPSGEYQVEFIYQPASFQLGLWLSGLSLMGWVLVGGWGKIKERR